MIRVIEMIIVSVPFKRRCADPGTIIINGCRFDWFAGHAVSKSYPVTIRNNVPVKEKRIV